MSAGSGITQGPWPYCCDKSQARQEWPAAGETGACCERVWFDKADDAIDREFSEITPGAAVDVDWGELIGLALTLLSR